MSLQVWLPLNGNLHNQGLSNYNISMLRGSAIFDNNGKIGKCFHANGVNTIKIENIIPDFYNYSGYSLCVWFYIESQNTSHSGSGIISAGNWNNQILNLALSDWSTDHYTRLQVSGTSWNKIYNYTFNKNTWYHVVVSSDGNKTYAYVNGVLIGNTVAGFLPTSIEGNNIAIGGATYYSGMQFFGKINDVRIYDHALSAKEVEEIAKGLILHYKLDDTYSESTTNLITTVDGLSNTCYNGAINKYYYGTNTDMYKTTGTFQGKFCTKVYMGTAGNSAYPYVYFDPFNAKGTEIQTLSFDYYPTIQDTLIPYSHNGSYNFSYTSNGIPGSATNASQIIIPVNVGQWNHITITAQKYDTTNTSRGIGYVRIGSAAHTSTTTDYWLFANVQVEAKDHATGYAGVGGSRVATIIYDSSGYGNNGTIIGSLETVNDSSRYSCATKFNGSSAIKVNDNNWMAQGASDLTVNIWAYMDNWSNWNGNRLYSCTEGGGFNIENTIANSLTFPVCVYTNTAHSATGYIPTESRVAILKTDLTPGWHMFTYIYTEIECKCYLDGVLYQTKLYTSYGVYFNMNGSRLFLGCEANGVNASGPYFIGNESDFRIYYTALTSKQIKELYNTSMSIDNNGNIHTRELVEL